jgi:class 3 adenylate cyclase
VEEVDSLAKEIILWTHEGAAMFPLEIDQQARVLFIRSPHKEKDLWLHKGKGLVTTLQALEKKLKEAAEARQRAQARGTELVSAKDEVGTIGFRQWAGNVDTATLAVVFTDIVGSTELNQEMKDTRWSEILATHFERARQLINEKNGHLVKTLGDGVMAGFRGSADALEFALAFASNTGHEAIKIRAGIHVGLVVIKPDGDVSGHAVNFVQRVAAKAEKGGVWVSQHVKDHIEGLGRPKALLWTKHPDQELKGFPDTQTLWSVTVENPPQGSGALSGTPIRLL